MSDDSQAKTTYDAIEGLNEVSLVIAVHVHSRSELATAKLQVRVLTTRVGFRSLMREVRELSRVNGRLLRPELCDLPAHTCWRQSSASRKRSTGQGPYLPVFETR